MSTTTQSVGGTSVAVRSYGYSTSDQVAANVVIYELRVSDVDSYANSVSSALVNQFRSAGGKDVAVMARTDFTVHGNKGVSWEFNFTAADGTQPAWAMAVVASPKGLVLIQCFDSSPTASLTVESAIGHRIISSLIFG